MKMLSVVLLAIVAIAGAACEQHSASELKSAHGDSHKAEAIPHTTEVVDPKPEPLAPHGVPQNPSGAAPADPHAGDKPAPKFFPEK